MNNNDIVNQLWKLCDVLRDDGVTYHQYVTELTYLLFLKMAQETQAEAAIPEDCRWGQLVARDGKKQLDFYRELLLKLGREGKGRVQAIYADSYTTLRRAKNLATIVTAIDSIDWFNIDEEGIGDLYEGLLEKNAQEKKSGAGQYFTPRPLIDCMVALTQPRLGEVIQDPAAGTAGFLVTAHQWIMRALEDEGRSIYSLSAEQAHFQLNQALWGVELVQDTHRLALMNLMLHGIEGGLAKENIDTVAHDADLPANSAPGQADILDEQPRAYKGTLRLGDALGSAGASLLPADVILTNPPFGTKKGSGTPNRADFTVTHDTSNKQLAFVEHIFRGLKPGGRAAVVLPDNVLFEDNTGKSLRTALMERCNLHTILRLPTGIFYAQGVKTNVLFFQRGHSEKGNTTETWVYDLRTNMPSFGKRNPFTLDHLKPFMDAYGADPNGKSPRTDQGEEGRFRRFTRAEIAERNDDLNITWLRDDSIERAEDLPDPEEIANEILNLLRTATKEMEDLSDLLDG
ncbi:MAG: SAM-dependent methyltransferase [Myxococcales bacterium]|nr:SAM-dependent methyltransferase [Myxococcales bacterium]